MRRFAGLVELLTAQTDDAARLALLVRYLRDTADPDRGWALAVLTGAMAPRLTTPAMLRRLAASRIDQRLFALSQEFVGDLAETVALIWPEPADPHPVRLTTVIAELADLDRKQAPQTLSAWLDRLATAERWVLLRLAGGRLGGTVSGRLARRAVAMLGDRPLADVESLWHAVPPPYTALLAWAEGHGAPPPATAHGYRPMQPIRPAGPAELAQLSFHELLAEWCWLGRRIQIAQGPSGQAVYDTAADDISAEAPELLAALPDGQFVLEGVLLPEAHRHKLMLYDMQSEAGDDLGGQPLHARRARLQRWFDRHHPAGMALSPVLATASLETADRLRATPVPGARGLILKPAAGRYGTVDSADPWLVWLRDAPTIAAVIMYARPEGGTSAGSYTDITVGLWQDGRLVPVGRVTAAKDAALRADLDAWVRAHATAKHGPVREVPPLRVLRIAFDAVALSRRHKAGLVLRKPRIAGTDDRDAAEADKLSDLKDLLDKGANHT